MDLRDTITIYTKDCKRLDKEGQVFIYTNPITQQQLVLKPQDNTERFDDPLNLLIHEFKKMVLLSSEPEIATVYYLVKVNDDKIGYLMEYIKGQSLKEYLLNNSNITYEFAYNIIINVISGIEKAHHYGVTHDDLHEGNIMIDERGFCKLIDFIDFKATSYKYCDIGLENDFSLIENLFEKLFQRMSEINDKRKLLALQMIFKKLRKENSLNGLTHIIKNTSNALNSIFFYEPIMLRILPLFFQSVTVQDVKSMLMTVKKFTIKLDTKSSYNYHASIAMQALKTDIEKSLMLGMNFLLSIGIIIKYEISFIQQYQNNEVGFSVYFTVTPLFFDIYTIVSQYHILDIYRSQEDLNRSFINYIIELNQNVHKLGKEKKLDESGLHHL